MGTTPGRKRDDIGPIFDRLTGNAHFSRKLGHFRSNISGYPHTGEPGDGTWPSRCST